MNKGTEILKSILKEFEEMTNEEFAKEYERLEKKVEGRDEVHIVFPEDMHAVELSYDGLTIKEVEDALESGFYYGLYLVELADTNVLMIPEANILGRFIGYEIDDNGKVTLECIIWSHRRDVYDKLVSRKHKYSLMFKRLVHCDGSANDNITKFIHIGD